MNSIPTYDADVLIAGAGPSGSICAYYLAQAGKKVILIDSEEFPREKICGGFVSPVGINELINIGIGDQPGFQTSNVITCAAVHIDGQKLITDNIPDLDGMVNYGRVFQRTVLDNLVLEAARKQGVTIITSCKLENYTVSPDKVIVACKSGDEERTFTVRMIIGADGSNSTVARIMNGKRPDPAHRIVAVRVYFENIRCTPNQAELYFSSGSFPGYYWFFPMGPTSANVGVGMSLENFPREETNLKTLLHEVLANDAALNANTGDGIMVGKIEGWPLSIYNPEAVIVKDRILLTGDAAGLINSINGEGIQYALQSGRWAAESVIECLSKNDLSARSLRSFDRKVRKEIGYDMSLSNLVLQFIRNRNFNPFWMEVLKIFIEQAKVDDRYTTIAGGILAGMVPTKEAISPYFIWKTGIRVTRTIFRRPFTIFNILFVSVKFGFAITAGIFKQWKEYRKWLKGLAKGAFLSLKLVRF
jgi:menaquinone-9 beta-reductase